MQANNLQSCQALLISKECSYFNSYPLSVVIMKYKIGLSS